jgi:glyoxylase-like metal-dependent hydrolase (beta-lactamase superfamily II)
VQVELLEVTIEPGFTENAFLVAAADGSGLVAIVDPGAQPDKIMKAVGERTVESIILTHRHSDHIGALAALAKRTGAKVYAHKLDADVISNPPQRDRSDDNFGFEPVAITTIVEEGDTIPVGSGSLEVLHTPGHTIGSMCLYGKEDGILIAGDTLFYEGVGRTDFPTGSVKQQIESLKKLAKLPAATKVYPGHDQLTTIDHEKHRGALRSL